MPTFYRIEKRRHLAEAFSGIGGLLSAGRWHRRGIRVAYAAEHPAVAVLEKLVWLGSLEDAAAGDYVVVPVDITGATIETLALDDLPGGWDAFPHPPETQELGTRWLREGRSAALRVPSAVVPQTTNVLINPAHPDAAGFAAGAAEAFDWDPRLFAPRPGAPDEG